MSKYTPQQMAAITSESKMVATIAGPGSGKTTMLVGRIARDFRTGFSDPAKTAVITFTNAAANELVSKLTRAGVPTPNYVGTLHGWCLRQIQRNNMTVLSEALAQEIMEHVIDEHRVGTTAEKARKAITNNPKKIDGQTKLAITLYRKTLREQNAVDFDLILVVCLEQLEHTDSDTAHLYVDEFQDTNEIDLKICDAVGPETMFVVGDFDQSIYAFRGARIENLQEFCKRPTTAVYLLEDNWRSVPAICAAADRVIANNPDRVQKSINPAREPGPKEIVPITFTGYNGEGLEQLKVCDTIGRMINDEGRKPEDIAILVRYNADLHDFQDALAQAGIPVSRPKRRPQDWKRAEAALSALVSPTNTMAVMGWRMAAGESWAVAKATVDGLRQRNAPLMPGYMLDATGNDYTGRRDAILHALRTDGIGRATLELIDDLRLSKVTDILVAMRSNEDSDPGVTVTNYHKAKGLEWPVVFMPACEDRMVSKDAEGIQEDRRLFFVAITRARDQLHISAAESRRTAWGAKLPAPTGGKLRFIDEMGLDA